MAVQEAKVSEEMQQVVPGFQLADSVVHAAKAWSLQLRLNADGTWAQCFFCGQSVMCLSQHGISYTWTMEQLQSQVLAHMLQRHGWVREGKDEG